MRPGFRHIFLTWLKRSPFLFRVVRIGWRVLRQALAAIGRGEPLPPDEIAQAKRIVHNGSRGAGVPASGPRVLFYSLRAWPTHLAWETTIAHGLIRRGAQCEFFFCSRELPACDVLNWYDHSPAICDYCARFTKDLAAGFSLPYRQLREMMTPSDRAEARQVVDGCPPERYETFEYAGMPLGEYVQPSVAHFLCAGTLTQDAPSRQAYHDFLVSAVLMQVTGQRLLDAVRPDIVFMVNGLFFAERIMLELARQRRTRVVTYEAGFRDNTLVFAHDRPVVDMVIGELWKHAKDTPLTAQQAGTLDEYLAARFRGQKSAIADYWPSLQANRQAIFKSLHLDTQRTIVTLFSNILWDTAIYQKNVAFPGMLEWIYDTIDYFAHKPDVQLIVRVHPAEVRLVGQESRERVSEALAQRYAVLPENVILVPAESDLSSYVLMEMSHLGLVYTSTAGLEMVTMGIPVIVAGETHFRGKGFTLDVTSPDDYHRTIQRLLERNGPMMTESQRELARRYAYTFLYRFMSPFPLVSHLGRNLNRFNYTSPSDLDPGKDASLDLICSAILERREFIAAEDAGE